MAVTLSPSGGTIPLYRVEGWSGTVQWAEGDGPADLGDWTAWCEMRSRSRTGALIFRAEAGDAELDAQIRPLEAGELADGMVAGWRLDVPTVVTRNAAVGEAWFDFFHQGPGASDEPRVLGDFRILIGQNVSEPKEVE